MTLAKTSQLTKLAYWPIQGGALNMCSLLQPFLYSCSSETDPQADTTSHQPWLASSACAECNYVRSQLGLYHSRPCRPPAVLSKDGLEPGLHFTTLHYTSLHQTIRIWLETQFSWPTPEFGSLQTEF